MRKPDVPLPVKTNRILNGILVVLLLIAIRIWHLAVVQHEEKMEASRKPQRRAVVEKSDRATIVDRHGKPLAVNKIQYNVAVSYGGIREVPRHVWEVGDNGKKIKRPKRKEYIHELAQLLGKELEMDGERIEDLIHAKASLFGNVPYVIKENVSEQVYYRLKMLEKEFPGLVAEKSSHRWYPQGSCGAEVVGYLGAISKEEYENVTGEMLQLREALNASEEGDEREIKLRYATLNEVAERLSVLEGKAYTINDLVGKVGVEKSYDEKLRGSSGMKTFLADPRGNFLQELPIGREPAAGNHLVLSLSTELQEYAEKLLIEYEQAPLPNHAALMKLWSHFPEKQPWIKGGAIVVMDAKSGEIYALASYPRFDGNDFVKGSPHKERVQQWLENDDYIAALWNQKQDLKRERYDTGKKLFFEESMELTWRNYLRMILPSHSPVLTLIEKRATLRDALLIAKKMERLIALFPQIDAYKVIDFLYPEKKTQAVVTLPEKEKMTSCYEKACSEILALKEDLKPFFATLPMNDDKLLLVDLYRVAIHHGRFPDSLVESVGGQTLADYRECAKAHFEVKEALTLCLKEGFHEIDFKKWREEYFKDYLADKRKEEEKRGKKWGRPYIEYLDEAERELFTSFLEKHGDVFLLHLLTKESLDTPLSPYLEKIKGIDVTHLKSATASLSQSLLIPYLKTFRSYRELNRELYGLYTGMRTFQGKVLEKSLASAFYPKGGFAYARSHAFRQSSTIGSVFKLVPAYEALKQRFLAGEEHDLNPLTIIDDKRLRGKEWDVGFTLDKKPIPRFYRGGLLPRSDHAGLGQVDLVRALAVSSNPYFALLSGDVLADPEDLCKAAALFSFGEKTGIDLPGEIKGNIPRDVAYNRTGLYSFSIGQHSLVGTPLQTAVMMAAIANGGKVLKPKVVISEGGKKKKREIKREIFLPKQIRATLLKGLQQVIMGEKGTARMLKNQFPHDLLCRVVGKTSTSEVVEKMSLDAEVGKVKCTHIAFSAISFHDPQFEDPDLVVIVYLRFGEWGRLASPYALKMIQKWEEIRGREGKEG